MLHHVLQKKNKFWKYKTGGGIFREIKIERQNLKYLSKKYLN